MKTPLVLAGAGLAAIGGSLCCTLPLVAILFGIGGLGFAAMFETFRWVFVGLTALFLGMGSYLIYFRANDECKADASCATPRRRRGQKIGLWVVTGLAAGLVGFPYYSGYVLTGFLSEAPRIASPSETAVVSLGVKGMTCASCVAIVTRVLEDVPGVLKAHVSLEQEQAEVTVRKGTVSVTQLIDAVNAAGFQAQTNAGKSADEPASPA